MRTVRSAWLGLALAAMCPAEALACSGPNAAETIARAIQLGWMLAGIWALASAVALLVLRLMGRRRALVPIAILVALHPGIWCSARMGDCGSMLRFLSVGYTATAGLGLAIWIGVAAVRRRGTRPKDA